MLFGIYRLLDDEWFGQILAFLLIILLVLACKRLGLTLLFHLTEKLVIVIVFFVCQIIDLLQFSLIIRYFDGIVSLIQFLFDAIGY